MKKFLLITFSIVLLLTGCSSNDTKKSHTIVFNDDNSLEYRSKISTTKLITRVDSYTISSSNIEGNIVYVSNLKVVCPVLKNVKKLGKVKLEYTIDDETYEYTAKIVDKTKPTIKLKKDILEFEVGEMGDISEYYEVKDNYDKAKNIKVEIKGLDDLQKDKVGEYTLTIKATDRSKNTDKKTLLIKIKDTKKEQEEKEAKEKAEAEQKASEEAEKSTSESSSSSSNTTQQSQTTYSTPVTKDFLFSDGYDIETAPMACNSALDASPRSGSCTPLQDSEGVYYGMRLTLN